MVSRLEISGIHYSPSDDLKKYITRKVGKLDRFVPRHARKTMHIEVKLTERKTKSDRNQCEIIVSLPEQQIAAKEATVNMFAAVDIVEAKVKTQLKKYKASHGGDKQDRHGKLRRLFRRRSTI